MPDVKIEVTKEDEFYYITIGNVMMKLTKMEIDDLSTRLEETKNGD